MRPHPATPFWGIWLPEVTTTRSRLYLPLDFSRIHGYPNLVPVGSSWHEDLTKFNGYTGVSAKQHLKAFDSFNDDFDALPKDVFTKIFPFSLLGDARVWYRILPKDTIDSLQSFSVKFKDHWQKFYLDHDSNDEQVDDRDDALGVPSFIPFLSEPDERPFEAVKKVDKSPKPKPSEESQSLVKMSPLLLILLIK